MKSSIVDYTPHQGQLLDTSLSANNKPLNLLIPLFASSPELRFGALYSGNYCHMHSPIAFRLDLVRFARSWSLSVAFGSEGVSSSIKPLSPLKLLAGLPSASSSLLAEAEDIFRAAVKKAVNSIECLSSQCDPTSPRP